MTTFHLKKHSRQAQISFRHSSFTSNTAQHGLRLIKILIFIHGIFNRKHVTASHPAFIFKELQMSVSYHSLSLSQYAVLIRELYSGIFIGRKSSKLQKPDQYQLIKSNSLSFLELQSQLDLRQISQSTHLIDQVSARFLRNSVGIMLWSHQLPFYSTLQSSYQLMRNAVYVHGISKSRLACNQYTATLNRHSRL